MVCKQTMEAETRIHWIIITVAEISTVLVRYRYQHEKMEEDGITLRYRTDL